MDREKERDNGGRISDAARVEETGKGRERGGGIRWKWREKARGKINRWRESQSSMRSFLHKVDSRSKCSVSVEQVL